MRQSELQSLVCSTCSKELDPIRVNASSVDTSSSGQKKLSANITIEIHDDILNDGKYVAYHRISMTSATIQVKLRCHNCNSEINYGTD